MKKSVFQILFILINISVFSQTTIDTLNLFLFSTDYSSNTKSFGNTLEDIKQPNFTTSINFISEHNFDISFSSVITKNADSTYTNESYEYDIMLGYNFNLNKKLSIYPSYTHLFHSKNSFALKSLFSDIFETDIYYSTKNFNSSLTYEYLIGTKNMSFACIQGAYEIEIKDFLIKNSLTNIQLGFYINYSDINHYNKFIYDSWDTESFLTYLTNNYPLLALSYERMFVEYGLTEAKEDFYTTIANKTDIFNTSYKISSIDFYIPIYYSLGNFMFNFITFLSVPVTQNDFLEQSSTFFFNAGISYGLSF